MPPVNRFRHQEYRSAVPTSPHYQITPPAQPAFDSDDFNHRMQAVGAVFRAAGVVQVYLVHGTFVGDDAFALSATLGRMFPYLESALRDATKQIMDALVSDTGNFTQEYAHRFETAMQRDGEPSIPVRLFRWSGQNNHIGRSDAAVRLIGELVRQRKAFKDRTGPDLDSGIKHRRLQSSTQSIPRPRFLFWGHSHAGNAFALMTNLLASDPATCNRFFAAARTYYQWPVLGCIDIPIWHAVKQYLLGSDRWDHRIALDFVTFGTPIRYGWDTDGYSRLLHFVNHRPDRNEPSHLAPFPPTMDRLRRAEDGDYVQQVGIAGTNFAPNLFAWRTLLADFRLGKLLQPGMRKRDLWARLQQGARIPDEGTTLLVDYGPGRGNLAQHAAGHAIYTRMEWLLFHAKEVARRLYS